MPEDKSDRHTSFILVVNGMNCDKYCVYWTENGNFRSCHNLSKNGMRALILNLLRRGVELKTINIRKL